MVLSKVTWSAAAAGLQKDGTVAARGLETNEPAINAAEKHTEKIMFFGFLFDYELLFLQIVCSDYPLTRKLHNLHTQADDATHTHAFYLAKTTGNQHFLWF